MDTENKAGMEQAIRGAEGLLEMGLYTEAEAVFRRRHTGLFFKYPVEIR